MAVAERNQDATIYVGGLDEKVSETILWELFVQAGPVVNVHMPKDRITQNHQGYGFVEFMSEEDADYAIKIMNMIKLYGKPIRVNKASAHQKNLDIGANLFIGNLDPEVDEKLLYDTFSAFGIILQVPKIMRDNDTNSSKGFAFINFASFDAADAALEAMNGQYLCNRPITISYAFKKDSKGERHGSEAERFLAAQNPLPQAERPHQLFADAPPTHPQSHAAMNAASMQPIGNMMGGPPMSMMPGMPMSMIGGMPPPQMGYQQPMGGMFGMQGMPFGLPPPPGMPMGYMPSLAPIGLLGPPMPFPMAGFGARGVPAPPPPPPPPDTQSHMSYQTYQPPPPPPVPPPSSAAPPPPPPPMYG